MVIRRSALLWSLAFCALAPLGLSAGGPEPVTSMILNDPSGDVSPIVTNRGSVPAYDVTTLAIGSDGESIVVKATLARVPGDFASDVVTLDLDVDNDAGTGVALFHSEETGFEYQAMLLSCVEYEHGSVCAGAFDKTPKSRYATASISRYGDSSAQREPVGDVFAAQRFPFSGNELSAHVAYADLGVKPGQVIRIVARESGDKSLDRGYWPAFRLRLK